MIHKRLSFLASYIAGTMYLSVGWADPVSYEIARYDYQGYYTHGEDKHRRTPEEACDAHAEAQEYVHPFSGELITFTSYPINREISGTGMLRRG